MDRYNAQFEEQYEMGYASRFESIFYNMMSSFYEVRRMTNEDIKAEGKGCKDIKDLAEKLLRELRGNLNLKKEIPKLEKAETKDIEIKNIRGTYGNEYSNFISRHSNVMTNYFQYLFNMINFVIEYWENDKNLLKTYLNFIQAQLTGPELCLLFYNCLSKRAKDSNYQYAFFDTINDINFLQNLDEDWIADRSNHIFYNKTHFRFLHRYEEESKNP